MLVNLTESRQKCGTGTSLPVVFSWYHSPRAVLTMMVVQTTHRPHSGTGAKTIPIRGHVRKATLSLKQGVSVRSKDTLTESLGQMAAVGLLYWLVKT